MEWLSITLGVVSILGLLWAFAQIGEAIEAVNKAENKIAGLEMRVDRQREDINSLSGLLRSLTDDVDRTEHEPNSPRSRR
jgi:hypothetical protein